MKKIGKVIPFLSHYYKFIFLLSDKIISSHFDDFCINPYFPSGTDDYYKDLNAAQSFIFLQHGITQNDLSDMLGKYGKNFRLFITATKPEYDSILDFPYGYSANEVILTGFPRYDHLYDNNKNIITIMPTWRRYLFSHFDIESNTWIRFQMAEKSPYCRFYSNLLSNEQLIDTAKKHGYSLRFIPHPNLYSHMDLFSFSNEVKILEDGFSFRDVFADSSLIVTDYTSAVFDFAYLRKPVIYCHFDNKEFREKHYKEGAFNYENDGFGEVETTVEGTVDRIIEYIQDGCALKEKYRKRIDGSFAFNDNNNCKRVYDAILKLDSPTAGF
jgi:CDP-glycerol glycerophosphotransferase (TagB/SpsB family)